MYWATIRENAMRNIDPASNSRAPGRDTIAAAMSQQKEKGIEGRIRYLTAQGARPGLIVHMKRTGSLKIMASINANGQVFMDGVRIPCSPYDYDLIQGF